MGMQKMNPEKLVKMIGYEHLFEGSISQKVASRKVILNSFESDLVERNENLTAQILSAVNEEEAYNADFFIPRKFNMRDKSIARGMDN
jgi:hypothetical protein